MKMPEPRPSNTLMGHHPALRRYTAFALILLFSPLPTFAGTITGQVVTATTGPVPNATIGFTLSQFGVQAGSFAVVPSTQNCWTDAGGNVVGLPDPLVAPGLSANYATGTLPAGVYFAKIALYTGATLTAVSPERTFTMTGAGTLIVQAPGFQPVGATGFKVFLSSATNTETLQGTQASFTNFNQSAPLVSGAAMPAFNNTVCSLVFNDSMIPTGTYYLTSLLDANGGRVSGFPQKWGLSGTTVNLSSGMPIYQGTTIFPSPVLSVPSHNSTQSISGSLDIRPYFLCAGNVPCPGGPPLPVGLTPVGGIVCGSGQFVTTVGPTSFCSDLSGPLLTGAVTCGANQFVNVVGASSVCAALPATAGLVTCPSGQAVTTVGLTSTCQAFATPSPTPFRVQIDIESASAGISVTDATANLIQGMYLVEVYTYTEQPWCPTTQGSVDFNFFWTEVNGLNQQDVDDIPQVKLHSGGAVPSANKGVFPLIMHVKNGTRIRYSTTYIACSDNTTPFTCPNSVGPPGAGNDFNAPGFANCATGFPRCADGVGVVTGRRDPPTCAGTATPICTNSSGVETGTSASSNPRCRNAGGVTGKYSEHIVITNISLDPV